MTTRRRLAGGLLLVSALVLAGCSADGEETPEAAGSQTTATTDAPEAPGSAPVLEAPSADDAASASPELCGGLHTALRETKEIDPDPDAVDDALADAAAAAPEGLTADVETLEEELRAYLEEHAETEGVVDPFESEVPAGLTSSCDATGVDLENIPYAEGTVAEVCFELRRIAQYQDMAGLEEIIDVSLRRASTYAPPEIEAGVQAYSDQMQTVWDEERPTEPEENRQARLTLGEVCAAEDLILLQPSD